MEKNKEIKVIEDEIIIEIMKDHIDLYDELNFHEYNIKDKLEKNSYLYEQYRILYMSELHRLKRIEIAKDKYIGDLYQELKNGDRKLSKVEIEKYFIPADEKAIKWEKLYMRQKIRCDTYQYIADAFKQQSFNMNTYIKNLQL